MRIATVEKTSNEKFAIGLRYESPDLSVGETIVSCVASVDEEGDVVLDGNVVISTNTISQSIKEGTDGTNSFITFLVTTSGGSIYEDTIMVKVRDKTNT